MLSKEQIIDYLQQLGGKLAAQGLHGEILITGGAVMCLVHEARDATKDIDALYEPKSIINEIAAQIAEENDLPNDWLNDSVKGFMSVHATAEDFMTFDGLHVQTVTAEYLLAMKLMSARYGERDYEDIRFLLDKIGVYSAQQAFDILQHYFPTGQILPKTMYVIEELLLGSE